MQKFTAPFNALKLLVSVTFLGGCTTFNFDYKPPLSGPTATAIIKSKWEGYNQRVIYHSITSPCSGSAANLVGLLNAGAIGQKNVKQIEIKIPADQDVLISLPQFHLTQLVGGIGSGGTATFQYCQPVVKIKPSPDKTYVFEFDICSGNAFEQGSSVAAGEPYRSCKVTSDTEGNPGKMFLLKDNKKP